MEEATRGDGGPEPHGPRVVGEMGGGTALKKREREEKREEVWMAALRRRNHA